LKLAAVKNGSVLTFFPFSGGILIHSLQLAQPRGPARLILRSSGFRSGWETIRRL